MPRAIQRVITGVTPEFARSARWIQRRSGFRADSTRRSMLLPMLMRTLMRTLMLLPPLVVGAGCAQALRSGSPEREMAYQQLNALEWQRHVDSESFDRYSSDGDASIRARAARALGRIQTEAARELLVRHARGVEQGAFQGSSQGTLQSQALVETVFALGQIPHRDNWKVLEPLLGHDAPEIRARAVEAIGKLGAVLPKEWQPVEGNEDSSAGHTLLSRVIPAVVNALSDRQPMVRGAAALALWRLDAASTTPQLLQRLDSAEHPDVRWKACYSIARMERPETRGVLRPYIGDSNPWVRTFAARGLGNPADDDSVGLLRDLYREPGAPLTAKVEALRSLGKFIRTESAPLVEAFRALCQLPTDKEHPLLVALRLEILGQAFSDLSGDESTSSVLRSQFGEWLDEWIPKLATEENHARSIRRAALVAWAQIAGTGSLPGLLDLKSYPDSWIRAAAANALGWCGLEALPHLVQFEESLNRAGSGSASDPNATESTADGAGDDRAARDPFAFDAEARSRVMIAITEARMNIVSRAKDNSGNDARYQSAWEALRRATQSKDPAVREIAVRAFATEQGPRWIEVLTETFAASPGPLHWEARKNILEFLQKSADDRGKQEALRLANGALDDPMIIVRRTAETILERPHEKQVATRVAPAPLLHRDQITDADPPEVILHTTRGKIRLELYLDDAPLHVSNIIHLARNGFYDGLPFHRVVPSFVIQGGDPWGNGWGDNGYHLPDETNMHPYLRGTLGMPKAGKDTGGCQIFITHLPTPHLDGRYTVFGRVITGMEVVDRIEVGDIIERAEVNEYRFREQDAQVASGK